LCSPARASAGRRRQTSASPAVGSRSRWFFVALYGGLALALEDANQETVLPLFRRGQARGAIEGGLDEQLEGLAREAGVRQQL
jgi:hypothetical protein